MNRWWQVSSGAPLQADRGAAGQAGPGQGRLEGERNLIPPDSVTAESQQPRPNRGREVTLLAAPWDGHFPRQACLPLLRLSVCLPVGLPLPLVCLSVCLSAPPSSPLLRLSACLPLPLV